MKKIFESIDLDTIELKNRLVRSATGENLATSQGGIPNDLMGIYEELAQGGVGLIFLSFTSVAEVDHFNTGLLRLHQEAPLDDYQELVNMIHSYNCKVMPQLALGIYQRKIGNNTYIPVEINEMDVDDIKEVKTKFVSAAKRALTAGFDGIQLHGTHNFVLSSFLNPAMNKRTDEYGGDIFNRSRIFIEIIGEIKEFDPNFHVSIKLNSIDLPPTELMKLCLLLESNGLNSVEYEGVISYTFLELQGAMKIPLILTGGLKRYEDLDLMLNEYDVEIFGMARPLIREPNLPNRWNEINHLPSDCRHCGRCMTTYGYRCALKKVDLTKGR
ncbi:oxidoreductase [Enterococcus sp. LJL120]